MSEDTALETQYPNYISQYVTPTHFFGEEDANVEWKNPEKSVSLFFHTEAYKEFQRPDCLYLFGRRGTGKTALIRMLNHEVHNGEVTGYSFSSIVDAEDAYHDLSIQLRGSPLTGLPSGDLVHLLTKKWNWVILIAAMKSVYATTGEVPDDVDISTISRFLNQRGFVGSRGSRSIWRKLAKCVGDNLAKVDYAPAKLGQAVTLITDDLFSEDFEDAADALGQYLERINAKSVVMIDSIEVYELRDTVSESVTSALIQSVCGFYTKGEYDRVSAKAAFPSELYPRLKPINREKVDGMNLFILWKYRDLTCFMAKRYFSKFGDGERLQLSDLDSYRVAQTYLYSHIPRSLVCEQGLDFDTLAYIMRHTQKKPRQIITVFNTIHSIAETNDSSHDHTLLTAEDVRRGVHARLDLIIDGSLEIFDQVFPKGSAIVKRILQDMPGSFDYKYLTKKLPETNALQAEGGLNREDVMRLLLESGVLGVVREEGRKVSGGLSILEAFFEYQIKGVLQCTNETTFVVHPMMYQESNIRLDLTQYVYPVPLESEELEIIKSTRMHLA